LCSKRTSSASFNIAIIIIIVVVVIIKTIIIIIIIIVIIIATTIALASCLRLPSIKFNKIPTSFNAFEQSSMRFNWCLQWAQCKKFWGICSFVLG